MFALPESEMIGICFSGNIACFYYIENMVRVDTGRFIHIKIFYYFNNFIDLKKN